MLVSVSSLVFDIDGHVSFRPLPGNTDGDVSRRVNKVKALDGTVVVSDGGFVEGDREPMSYTWKTVSRAHNQAVERIVRLYSQVYVSTKAGVFLAAPDRFSAGDDQSTLSLQVIDKVSD